MRSRAGRKAELCRPQCPSGPDQAQAALANSAARKTKETRLEVAVPRQSRKAKFSAKALKADAAAQSPTRLKLNIGV